MAGVLAALHGRSTFSCLGNIPFFNALSSAKATAVVPITALHPVVTVLLAVTLLKERLGKFQVIGIALSLAAVYLLTVRRSADFCLRGYRWQSCRSSSGELPVSCKRSRPATWQCATRPPGSWRRSYWWA